MEKIKHGQVILKVEGMDCANCALGLKKQLVKSGIRGVEVIFATGELSFHPRDAGDVALVRQKTSAMGYSIVTDKADTKPKFRISVAHKFWFSLFFTLPLLAAMFLPWPLLHHPWFQMSLALPVFVTGWWHFGRSAWSSLRARVPNMDVLILLGSTAAFVYSLSGAILQLGHDYLFFETTASIISLILLGNYLEHVAVQKTTSSVDELMKLQKASARRLVTATDGTESTEEVKADQIRKDDILLVNTGDQVPVDGEILSGECSIDESMVSGESVPVERSAGMKVIAGTMLQSGNIRMKAGAVGPDTLLSHIIDMVRKAQQDKPRLQSLADKISAVFVPLIILISLITFAASFWISDAGLQESLLRSIAVIVIACPCALGLAIPTAVVVAVGRVARNGILIKGASTIQRIVGAKFIAFDKTGTLTDGRFRIRKWTIMTGDEATVKSVVSGLEMHSSHPLALALRDALRENEAMTFTGVREEKGIGMSGVDGQGRTWMLGSFRMASGLPEGHDLYLLCDGRLWAVLDLEDEIREGAAEMISYFIKEGLVPVMISGDREEKCLVTARKLGIERVYAERLPAEKLQIIEELGKQGPVIMVGDGINDAPALTRADVGVSLSNATGSAMESASVILLNGSLRLLPRAFGISRITLRVIRQNLFWAFFYNVIAIPIAAAGYLDPMIAAASMALSDVVVVLNSLRLRSKKY